MSTIRLPTEVELVFEVMPCNAMRTLQEPIGTPHPCTYFHKWGTYHSYDYVDEGPPPTPGILHKTEYVGRATLVPELLSGCRKAPILAVGINPNLPAWFPSRRNSVFPLFDDYKQFAHYFRYRSVAKLELSPENYRRLGGGPHDTPNSEFELEVPIDEQDRRIIAVRLAEQKMYQGYDGLLRDLASRMGWNGQTLTVGEDLSYANMVACPSARWTTKPLPNDPKLPPMAPAERDGIVTECFRNRRYFLRQLFQSLPQVLLVFSQNTAKAFIGELREQLIQGDPQPDEPITELLQREIRLKYGDLADGTELDARVVFSPHISGDADNFAAAREQVVEHLVDEARSGRLRFNTKTGHLERSRGACVFCTMLAIGACDYEAELKPISLQPVLTADSPASALAEEKTAQNQMLVRFIAPAKPVSEVWSNTDDEAKTESSKRIDSIDP